MIAVFVIFGVLAGGVISLGIWAIGDIMYDVGYHRGYRDALDKAQELINK